MTKQTEQRLRELEEALLSAGVRASPEALSGLLAGSFREFGCSGRVYDRSEALAAVGTESAARWSISDYRVTFLAPDIALATFRAARQCGDENIASLRSSVWKKFGGDWKLVFHQGTLSNATPNSL